MPLKARVSGVSGTIKYQVDGGKKEYRIIRVADSTVAIKCILYDRTKENNADRNVGDFHELHLQKRDIGVHNLNQNIQSYGEFQLRSKFRTAEDG